MSAKLRRLERQRSGQRAESTSVDLDTMDEAARTGWRAGEGLAVKLERSSVHLSLPWVEQG